jgi:archaellum component FlaF (FlaF/FlaG flagellin family)
MLETIKNNPEKYTGIAVVAVILIVVSLSYTYSSISEQNRKIKEYENAMKSKEVLVNLLKTNKNENITIPYEEI